MKAKELDLDGKPVKQYVVCEIGEARPLSQHATKAQAQRVCTSGHYVTTRKELAACHRGDYSYRYAPRD